MVEIVNKGSFDLQDEDLATTFIPLDADFSKALAAINNEREKGFGLDSNMVDNSSPAPVVGTELNIDEIGDLMTKYIEKYGFTNFLGKMAEVVRLQGYHFVENEVEHNFSGKRIKI